MTVAHDNATASSRTDTTTPWTFTHAGRAEASGGVQGVLLFVGNYTSNATISASLGTVTYGGATMTLRNAQSSTSTTEATACTFYYLFGSALSGKGGSQTVSIPFVSGSDTDDYWFVCVTLTGSSALNLVDSQHTGVVAVTIADPQVTLSNPSSKACMGYSFLMSGKAAVSDLTLLSGLEAVLSQDVGQEIQRFDRLSSTSTATSITVGYTATADDVSMWGVLVAESTTAQSTSGDLAVTEGTTTALSKPADTSGSLAVTEAATVAASRPASTSGSLAVTEAATSTDTLTINTSGTVAATAGRTVTGPAYTANTSGSLTETVGLPSTHVKQGLDTNGNEAATVGATSTVSLTQGTTGTVSATVGFTGTATLTAGATGTVAATVGFTSTNTVTAEAGAALTAESSLTATATSAAAITYVQGKRGTSADASTYVEVTLDATPTAGNLLVLGFAGDKNVGTTTINPPSGFTKVYDLASTSVSLIAAYKVSDGTETTFRVTVTADQSANSGHSLWVGEYSRGGTAGSGWDLVTSIDVPTTESTIRDAATGTTGTLSADGLAVAVAAVDTARSVYPATTKTWSNGYTERAESALDDGAGGIWAADKLVTASTTTGTTYSYSGSTSAADQWSTALLVLHPVSVTTHQAGASLSGTGGIVAVDSNPAGRYPPFTVALISDMQLDTTWDSAMANAEARLRALDPDYVILGGDIAYTASTDEYSVVTGELSDLLATMLVYPGNHDYANGNLTNYWTAFGSGTYAQGASASAPWYSVDINGWHVVVLVVADGSPGTNQPAYTNPSTQYSWLVDDLAANAGKPILAMWHQARYSDDSTHGDDANADDVFNLLYAYQADIVVNTHVHVQQRFPPADGSGNLHDDGVVEFTGSAVMTRGTIGTGSVLTPDWKSGTELAVLHLTLKSTDYEWAFVRVSDGAVLDSGTRTVHHPILTGFGFGGGSGLTATGAIRSGSALDASAQSGFTATATGTGYGAAALDAASSMTATASVTSYGALAASAESTLTAGALLTSQVAVALAGESTLTAAAVAVAYAGLTVDAGSTLTATGSRAAQAQAAPAGESTLTAAAWGSGYGATALAGAGELTAAATIEKPGAASLDATSTLTAAGSATGYGAAALDGSSTLTAALTGTGYAAATLAGDGSLTALATVQGAGYVSASLQLDATSTLDATAARTAQGGLAASGDGSLTAGGTRAAQAGLAAAGGGSLTAAGTATALGGLAASGEGSLTAVGAVTSGSGVSLASEGSLTATGTLTSRAAASLSGMAGITAALTGTGYGTSSLTGSSSLTVTASTAGLVSAGAQLDATSTAAATGLVRVVAAAALTGGTSLDATGSRAALATCQLTALGSLTGAALGLEYGTLTAAAVTGLLARGTVIAPVVTRPDDGRTWPIVAGATARPYAGRIPR